MLHVFIFNYGGYNDMGIMHKEVIEQRRDSAIVISVIFASIMIGLAKFIGSIRFYNFKLENITNPMFIAATLVALYIVFRKCKTSYKYSIVSDKLLIHRIISKNQKVLENIKVDNIIYFGNNKREAKKYKCKNIRKYSCGILHSPAHFCIYENNKGEYHKFYFQPSNEFITKINNFRLR